MTLSDWIQIVAIFLGPILAIQIQKWIERSKESRDAQVSIFRVLMGTRGSRLSPEHVTALNLIDLNFSEKNKKEKQVVIAWRALLDNFGKYPKEADFEDKTLFLAALQSASERSNIYLFDLLYEMSKCLGYDFDRTHLANGCYAPTGHAAIENEQSLVRKGLINVLYAESPLRMDIDSLPEQAPNASVMDLLSKSQERQEKLIEHMGSIKESLEKNKAAA